MRRFIAAVLAGGLFAVCFAASGAYAGELIITVTGLRSDAGVLRIAVYDQAAEFPEGTKLRSFEVPAQRDSVTVTLGDLPPGNYALAVHHDEDDNDEMATNAIGMPLEGYGFSNDAPVFLGPPAFDTAAFEIFSEDVGVALKIRY